MKKCCSLEEVNRVKNTLENNLNEAYFMYVDLCKFGYENNDVDFFFQQDQFGNITDVLMRYSNTLQVFSNREFVSEDVLDFVIDAVNSINAPIVTGSYSFIKELERKLSGFEFSFGYNYEVKSYPNVPSFAIITEPTDKQLYECADLIISDEIIGGFYDRDILAKQLIERRQLGFGRNLIIQDNEKIIAHIATYAEYAGVAITSGMIVHKDYRNRPYGFCLESKLMNDLLSEGFRVLTCLRSEQRIKLFDSLKIKDKCIAGKLLRK